MKKIFYFLSALIFLSACTQEDHVQFSQPQPTSVKPSKQFKSSRRGDYQSVGKKNETLTIDKNLIFKTSSYKFKVDRKTVVINDRANIDRDNDSSLLAYFRQLGGEASIQGDSITYTTDMIDTIFQINETEVLKYYHRNYYLNFLNNDSLWSVRKLRFVGDTLMIGKITPSDTLLRYNYTEVDTSSAADMPNTYVLDPSKNESKKLMRSSVFEITEKYIKIEN